jgi:putative transcriptional regulator
MTKANKTIHRSELLRSAHLLAQDLHAVGAISKTTMREFDVSCLTQVDEFTPSRIRKIRAKAHLSQAAFALTLNVTKTLVSQWERGEKRPSGPSAKLLTLADKKGIDAIL